MSDDNAQRFSDEQAKAILARAIEIDAHAPITTAADLRLIAVELGVSSAALEAAMREQTTSLETQRIAAAERAATRIAALGIPFGLATGWIASTAIMPALGLMTVGLVGSGAIAVYQSASGSLRAFQVKNLLFWAGVSVGSFASVMLLADAPALITAGWSIRSLIASSILGSATIVAVRRSKRASRGDSGDGGTDAAAPRGDKGWIRMVTRVLRAIVRPLRIDALSVAPIHRS
jgi:hypothetical protein